MKSLFIGSGNSTKRKIDLGELDGEIVTLDLQDADVIHDLEIFPYPFPHSQFDEIHAYEVLEHTGLQGDVNFFFTQFNELRRILKDGGALCLSVPKIDSVWAFGDPGHKRILPQQVFSFLTESHYDQVGKTSCADYRHLIEGYWALEAMSTGGESLYVVLRK